MPLVRPLWAALMDLAAERDCGGCGLPQPSGDPLCPDCDGLLAEGGPWRTLAAVPGTPRTHAVARYEDPVRTMLIEYKERGRSDLRRVLGRALARAVAHTLEAAAAAAAAGAAGTGTAGGGPRGDADGVPAGLARAAPHDVPPDMPWGAQSGIPAGLVRAGLVRAEASSVPPDPAWGTLSGTPAGLARSEASSAPPGTAWGTVALVPMPSRRKAVRERGQDTTARLAGTAARALREVGVPVRAVSVLRHARAVEDQAGLSRLERAENLSGALRVRRPAAVAGSTVVIVDDISTSGASLAEAARALRAAGVPVLGAATIAAARVRM